MSMTFPSDSTRGIPAWITKFTATLFRARYRTGVGDSNAAGKVPVTIQGAPSQTANLLEIYNSAKVGLAGFDASGNLITGGATKAAISCQTTNLTAANIIAMFTTPIAVTPIPAAGTAIIVRKIMVELNLTATAFSGGGVVHFYYHGLTAEVMSATLAAATINGAAAQTIYTFEPVSTAGGSVVTKEVGIDITNATGVFAAGTGAAVVTVFYSIVTLG